MRLAVTSDHAGFEALQVLKEYLAELGHDCVDFGPQTFDPNDDYPDYIFPAAEAVASGDCERAVILGGSGQGEAIAANRFANVRCVVFYGPVLAVVPIDAEGHMSDDPYEIVKLSRTHNDANVLSLSGRFLATEEMKIALKIWFDTPFSGAEHHVRRIEKLSHKGS